MEEETNLRHIVAKESDELKIELYPDNIPREPFTKISIKNHLQKNALAHSFDINKNYGYLLYNVPILHGLYEAYKSSSCSDQTR